ncbi:Gfo/Idh/MocA family protein [Bartonella ancashensis]|uniref:Oxidoreductase, Gfo/Idh/MocA family/transferase hexapeptide repeat protein n=1 Tax=Bartonella ancashensis TaxID=1318743 RepID=A0A0M5KZA2_9HYPH|nr:Gfo/Idh/MocA family oxidoreductase [Bartonella ancashensis]ALE03553.1 oxidoreductase, Gfo/Idh/MocA family/transferase hexapeptide repeat protein [Bartonella ancashensis]
MAPRIAVLGCGHWGKNHIRTLHGLGLLKAVSDIDFDRAVDLARIYGVESVTPDDLFANADIDALILALPPQFHTENVVRAVKNGKDVLVEKPIALNMVDAEYQVRISREYGRILMVGHILRFHPAFEKICELVESGELGDVRYIYSHRLGFGKFHTHSDALWDLAPHDLSMILALTKCEPSKVRGEGTTVVGCLSDFAHIHMEFSNGICSHLFTSRLSPYCERRLTVIGTKAMLVFDDMEPWDRKLAYRHFSVWQEGDNFCSNASEPNYINLNEDLPLTRELLHFRHCIETRQSPRTSAYDALVILRILATAGVSSRE